MGKPLVELAAVPCPTIPENNQPEITSLKVMCFLIQKNSKARDFRLYRVQVARLWKDATRSIRFTLHNLLRVFEFFQKHTCPPPNVMEVTWVWGVEVPPIRQSWEIQFPMELLENRVAFRKTTLGYWGSAREDVFSY